MKVSDIKNLIKQELQTGLGTTVYFSDEEILNSINDGYKDVTAKTLSDEVIDKFETTAGIDRYQWNGHKITKVVYDSTLVIELFYSIIHTVVIDVPVIYATLPDTNVRGITISADGSVFASDAEGVWKQTGGTGSFVKIYSSGHGGEPQNLCVDGDNNIWYAEGAYGAWKMTNATGSFVMQWSTNTAQINSDPNGTDIYFSGGGDHGRNYDAYKAPGGLLPVSLSKRGVSGVAYNGDIYFANRADNKLYVDEGNTGSFSEIQELGAEMNTDEFACSPTGDIYYRSLTKVWKRTSGIGLFADTGWAWESYPAIYIHSNGDIYYSGNKVIYKMSLNHYLAWDGGTAIEISGDGSYNLTKGGSTLCVSVDYSTLPSSDLSFQISNLTGANGVTYVSG